MNCTFSHSFLCWMLQPPLHLHGADCTYSIRCMHTLAHSWRTPTCSSPCYSGTLSMFSLYVFKLSQYAPTMNE